ncbi:MAG: MarR family winged helix-turn-helix transcriptional regulator [Bryobacteraceae bacterium]
MTWNQTIVLEDRREVFYHSLHSKAGPQYSRFDLLSSRNVLDLTFTCDVLHQILARYLAEFGLSRSTFNVLMLLKHGPPDGMQLHDIGELLLVSRANITGLINNLEEKGYVQRVVDTADRRVRYAKITRRAHELLDQVIPLHFANLAILLQDVTAHEKQNLVELLKRIRESVFSHANECIGQGSTDLA